MLSKNTIDIIYSVLATGLVFCIIRDVNELIKRKKLKNRRERRYKVGDMVVVRDKESTPTLCRILDYRVSNDGTPHYGVRVFRSSGTKIDIISENSIFCLQQEFGNYDFTKKG